MLLVRDDTVSVCNRFVGFERTRWLASATVRVGADQDANLFVQGHNGSDGPIFFFRGDGRSDSANNYGKGFRAVTGRVSVYAFVSEGRGCGV